MSVTIKDIARIAGVSYSTVSKALNNSPLVTEKTKRKILDIAQQIGYHPNFAAKSLVSKKSHTIGVVWPSVERAVWSSLATRINEKLENYSYHMLLSINPINSAVELFNRFQVDGILVFGNHEKLDETPSSVPILYYGPYESHRYPTINVNRREAIFKAVEHLCQLGHRRIAYIGELAYKDRNQQDKYLGFMEGIMKFSLPSHPDMAIDSSGYSWEDGYQATKRLLASDYRATAMIGGSYEVTLGSIRALKEEGYSIPGDFSIVSYDNIPQMETLEVPVTAVGVPMERISDSIVKSLMNLMNSSEEVPSLHEEEPTLVARSSSAPPSP